MAKCRREAPEKAGHGGPAWEEMAQMRAGSRGGVICRIIRLYTVTSRKDERPRERLLHCSGQAWSDRAHQLEGLQERLGGAGAGS